MINMEQLFEFAFLENDIGLEKILNVLMLMNLSVSLEFSKFYKLTFILFLWPLKDFRDLKFIDTEFENVDKRHIKWRQHICSTSWGLSPGRL